MTTYALQTRTMLDSVSNKPLHLLGAATEREDARPQLPTKRRREVLCALGKFNKPFTIKSYPDTPNGQAVTFKPVRVIGRSQLPLTFLDTSPDESFTANSLFSANIDMLESQGTPQQQEGTWPRILIAKHDTKRTLYAIERVRSRVYSICKLAGWIKEKEVAELWDVSNVSPCVGQQNQVTTDAVQGPWWSLAAVETEESSRPAKCARMSMMRKTTTVPAPIEKIPSPRFDSPAQQDTVSSDVLETAVLDEIALQLPSPQESLELLVQQYLDAVYLSKTSLAYLAKGPLTRIRNAFTSPEEGAPPTHELVTALRAMLLAPKASEKKYYDKLPSIIKALPPGDISDDDTIATANKARKTKKKMKLSRDGVYPHEEVAIRKWWNSELPSGESSQAETMDQRIKRRIGDLRVRETLAQLILMLEIIALETLATYKPAPDVGGGSEETQLDESQAKPKKRKRKLDDIALQLDLLLDRLSIWHATEESGILDFDSKPARPFEETSGTSKNGAIDRLRDFCIEVIVPFYMNRLPEQARMVNKKLGGPAHTSPPKRKAMKPPNTSRKSGEPKEPSSKKSRRSLTRVATENGRRTVDRKTPSLSRSFTDSALFRGIKREGSEVSLSAIPFQRSPSKNARRSVSQFRHLEGRELDLTTTSAAVTAKLKQKQRVEEEVKEAINALKKPNRGLAAGSYVDDIEHRGTAPAVSASRSRKPLNPVRKVVKDVQVTATPRMGRRTRDVIEHTPDQRNRIHNPFSRQRSADEPPSSLGFCIPSSGVRQRSDIVPGTVARSATGRDLTFSGIAETPSKAPNDKAFDSGVARRTIFATPLKPVDVRRNEGSPTASPIFKTPAKIIIGDSPFKTLNMAPLTVPGPVESSSKETIPAPISGVAESDDIYAALGWDDDDM